MKAKQKKPAWTFWAAWILATFAGTSIGFFAGFIAANLILFAIEEPGIIVMITGAGIGIGIGIMQWLVLRSRLPGTHRWIAPSALAGCAFFYAATGNSGSLQAGIILVMGGIITGTLQWFVLRKKVPLAGWWVLASALGWGLGLPVSMACGLAHDPAQVSSIILLGIITGGTMIALLRTPRFLAVG